MAKESTHRAEELAAQGWSKDDVARYAELWDYRQRWGAINLEREDRQFLRKAEAALPKILSNKASVKKPTQEKSYYRRLRFYLDAMDSAEATFNLKKGARGVWPILLEEELRVLDYYEPVLGLPDTLKAKKFDVAREEIVQRSSQTGPGSVQLLEFDFQTPLNVLKEKEKTTWKPLREAPFDNDRTYPVLNPDAVEAFRKEVRSELPSMIRYTLPSLSETEKSDLPDDWSRD